MRGSGKVEGVASAALSVYIRAMITIKRHTGSSSWLDPLEYTIANYLKSGEPPRLVVGMTCHNRHFATLEDHEISDDGTITPSVACPEDECYFHEMVRLEGWNANTLDNV